MIHRLVRPRAIVAASAVAVLTTFAACSSEDPAKPAGAGDAGPAVDEASAVVHVVKEFYCDPNEVQGTVGVLDVSGDGGELALRSTDAPCQFDLLYVKDGQPTVLSPRPGGYLLMAATATTDGTVVACASNIVHSAGADGVHAIDAVALECATKRPGAAFGPLTRVVEGGPDYAAWVEEVRRVEGDPSRFEVTWHRDFSFQFMNLATAGRPPTDGLYATSFGVEAGGALARGDTTPGGGTPLAPEAVEQVGWDPTPEELGEATGFVQRDEGACPPPGCPN